MSRLVALPGGRRPDALVPGRGHVTIRTKAEPVDQTVPTVMLCVSLLEASLIRSVLKATGSLAGAQLAAKVGEQCHPSRVVVVDTDPTPAHGTVRP